MPDAPVPAAPVTAALVIIGNEILSGRTTDANLPFLAKALNEVGVRLAEARVVMDIEADIIEAVNACRARHTYVFTTGGIGPTHDDITAECIAKAFGVAIEENAEALACLMRNYRPEDLNPMRRRMARIPAGASLIANPISNAPGFRIGNVYVMAGVPSIMQAMFDGIRHTLAGGAPMLARTVTMYLPEGLLAEGLADIQARHPTVEIGSYPFVRLHRLGTSVVARGTDIGALASVAAGVVELARSLGAPADEIDDHA